MGPPYQSRVINQMRIEDNIPRLMREGQILSNRGNCTYYQIGLADPIWPFETASEAKIRPSIG